MPCDLAVILMRILTAVRQDDIGADARFQRLEPLLDLGALFGEKAVPKLQRLHICACGPLQEVGGRHMRFVLTLAYRTQHTPQDVELRALRDPVQQCPAGTNLDVIRVGAQ